MMPNICSDHLQPKMLSKINETRGDFFGTGTEKYSHYRFVLTC